MKTLRAPAALLALVFAVVLVGSSCSSVDPVALQVGQWQLSTKTFEDQLQAYADAYTAVRGSDEGLHPTTDGTWSTDFTAFLLNEQLTSQLAVLAAKDRGLEVSDEDRAEARTSLEQTFSDSSGNSVFGDLEQAYQEVLVDGYAAQALLVEKLVTDATSDEALRKVYDADPQQFAEVCASHILVRAGEADGQTTPSDDDYATALDEIERIQSELDGATNFAEVATAESDDPGSATQGGSLGCSPKGSFVKEFDDAAWSQPLGEVGEPVKTLFGYHLILVTSRTQPTFDDVKEQLASSIEQSVQSLVQAALADVAADTDISVDGRFGRYDAEANQILAPEGADPAPTVDDTVAPDAQ